MATATLVWNKSTAQIITDKGFGPGLNEYFAKTLWKYAYPYTPYDPHHEIGWGTSHMVDNVRFWSNSQRGQIIYQASYAKDLYGKDYHFQVSPGHTPVKNWADWAWQMHRPEIVAEVDAKRKQYAKP